MSPTLLILKIYTTFKDVQMMLTIFFDISTGFRFSKISVECSVHLCSCPWSRLQAIQSKRISNKTIEPLQNTVATSYLLLFNKWLLQFLNDDKFIINKYDWLETQFLNLVYFTHTPLCRNFIATPLLVPIIIDAVEVLTVSVGNT